MADKPKNMREAMPKVAAWIDDLRGAFGADDINASMRHSVQVQPCFWARENGHEVGTRYTERGAEISAANMVLTPKEKTK